MILRLILAFAAVGLAYMCGYNQGTNNGERTALDYNPQCKKPQ